MKKRLATLMGFLLLAACGSNGAVVETEVQGVDGKGADGGADLRNEEIAADLVADLGTDLGIDLGFDFRTDEASSTCEAGSGCFGDPCVDNEDCLSGWCVDHMGDGICTDLCQEECPPGWSCQQVGTGPDVAWICISNHANLCRPCSTGDNCKSPGGAEDVCVDYGSEGSFCGGTCLSNEECPWGFSCGETSTVDGVPTKQCVADAGVCPCTAKSVELALSTTCEVTNEWGTCKGKRVCTEEGLTDCDAAEPSIEVCNGIDDDCDGLVDEPVEGEGELVPLCDDGNACTKDTCGGEIGCGHLPLTDVECMDGDSCTVGDHCEAGVCVGSPVVCDDQNPCTTDSCDGFGGCSFVDNTAACDDGNACTVADTCAGGECVGTPVNCDCQADADCAAFEDGDLCNGTLLCNQEKWPYQCQVDPETVIVCPEPEGIDAICLAAVCEPESGACSFAPAHEGYACADGSKCTIGDTCQAGVCTAGAELNCKDDNPCTDDSCDVAVGCVYTPNGAPCQDGNACTVGDTCADSLCQPGTGVLSCDDGNVCTDDSCDPAVGCVHAANAAPCDDGNACTTVDQCVNKACKGTEPLDCDDGNVCTNDSCNPALGCVPVPNVAPCDDDDACTVGDICADAVCQPGAPLNCDDDNVCTDDWCDPAEGCFHVANEAACDDNNTCTPKDLCVAGKCVGTGTLKCDDGNVCTKDVCLPKNGCTSEPVDGLCSDGNACTVGDYCEEGSCVSGPVKECDDGNVCTAESCDTKTGNCLHQPAEGDCDDGNACTVGDHCVDGACKPSGLENCDDDNVCTNDFCDPAEGCLHLLNTAPCDDGDLCTTGDKCQLGECMGTGDLVCNDNNPCTDDSCNPEAGCQFTPNNGVCDDGNACTTVDACVNGACKGSVPPDCDDDNLCTTDGCDPDAGCIHVNNANPCDDGDFCTVGDLCGDGACVSGEPLVCSDDNPCTDDSCVPLMGCVFVDNDVACDDGDACTDGDTCAGGICEPGGPTDCDDGNVCTDDSCDPQTGCLHTYNNMVCNDGNACTVTDQCIEGECVGSGAPDCDDADLCTSDSCDPDIGCVHDDIVPCCGNGVVEAGEECDDGNHADGDGCSSQCVKTQVMIGSYVVSNGPAWGGNPPCYTCREACALLFGGNQSQYRCSTVQGSINYKAWLDGWGDIGSYCGGSPGADDWKKSTYYNCGSGGCSYSAYVHDHGCDKTNYCWKL